MMKTVLFLGDIYRVDDSVSFIEAEVVYANHGKNAIAYSIFARDFVDRKLLERKANDASGVAIDQEHLSIEAHDASEVLDFMGAARYFYYTDDTDDMHQLCKDMVAKGIPWWFNADYLAIHAGLKLSLEMWLIIRSYSNPPSRVFQLPGHSLVLEIPRDTAIVEVEADGTIVAIADNGNRQQVGWTKLIGPQRFDARMK